MRSAARRVRYALAVLLLCALLGAGCRGQGGASQKGAAIAPPAGASSVQVGEVAADLFGTSSPNGVVIVSPPEERTAWQQVGPTLVSAGYRVLLYTRPDRGADATARREGDLLRTRGAEKVIFVGSRAAAADALAAGRDDASGVVVINPLSPPEPIPAAGMPPAPLLALASLTDGPASALARRIYDAAQEPRTLALYPAKLSGPAALNDASTAEVRGVFMDFLHASFGSLTA